MIRYALSCSRAHAFEAWFASSGDYDSQAARGLIACPFCGTVEVSKQIMAPAVARRGGRSPAETPPVIAGPDASQTAAAMQALAEVRRHVETNFDYVGDRFAREARDIHEGVSPVRAVYGEASAREVRDLVADGVPVAPLPPPLTPVVPKGKLN